MSQSIHTTTCTVHVLENTELVLHSSYLYVAVTSRVIQNDVDTETVTISNLRTQGRRDRETKTV